MMNKFYLIILFFFSLLSFSDSQAQVKDSSAVAPVKQKGSFSLVINPVYYVLGGNHLKFSYHFPRKWSVGATLQGGFTLPSFARDQFFEVSEDNMSVHWNYAVGIEGKYRFTKSPYDKGFLISVNLGYETWSIQKEQASAYLTNWFSSIDVAYHWYPFKKEQFHVGLQYTLIFILNNNTEQSLDGASYRLRPVVPPSFIPTIFIGWRF